MTGAEIDSSREMRPSGRLRRGALQVVAAFGFGLVAWLVASYWWWPAKPEPGPTPVARDFELSPIEPIESIEPIETRVAVPLGAELLDVEILRERGLLIPVRGVEAGDLADDFGDARSGGRRHEAIDIAAPRDTPVLAVDDGRIAKLFESEFGGLGVYQFDASGRYCFYYAHLERYPRGLVEGDEVRRGDTLGYVGTSGNAPENVPHLHFAIYRLGAERRWWEGEPINPWLVLSGDEDRSGG
jgi:murein DD-endopeptidase MepM/ murein hydrolase activator NlpD